MGASQKAAHLLGVGLDGRDGHVRLTRGKNFHLFGGSEETHERMQESCILLNEKLDARGKSLEGLCPSELKELAAECRMNLVLPGEKQRPAGEG